MAEMKAVLPTQRQLSLLRKALEASGRPSRLLVWLGRRPRVARSGRVDVITIPSDRSDVPPLRAVHIGEFEARPEGFPEDVPFLPRVSCCVMYHPAGGLSANWPAIHRPQPHVAQRLEALLPPSYVYLEHPRRFEAAVTELLSLLHALRPGDERERTLEALRQDAVARAARLPEQSDPHDWMAPEVVAAFWDIFDSVDTPGDLVRSLGTGFDTIRQQYLDQGWAPSKLRTGPFRTRDRVTHFTKGKDFRFLHRAARGGYCSLFLEAGADA